MEQGRFLLERLDAKYDLLKQLKTLLEEQQVLLVENRISELQPCVEQISQCTDALQRWESRWQEAMQTLRSDPPLLTLQGRELLFMVVDEQDHPRLVQLLDRLALVGKAIQELRHCNQQLMENSLLFVRSMLQAIQSGGNPHALYRPHKPLAPRSALVNKKL